EALAVRHKPRGFSLQSCYIDLIVYIHDRTRSHHRLALLQPRPTSSLPLPSRILSLSKGGGSEVATRKRLTHPGAPRVGSQSRAAGELNCSDLGKSGVMATKASMPSWHSVRFRLDEPCVAWRRDDFPLRI